LFEELLGSNYLKPFGLAVDVPILFIESRGKDVPGDA
jgi:hypothetical protein